jgi:hypothetical protein
MRLGLFLAAALLVVAPDPDTSDPLLEITLGLLAPEPVEPRELPDFDLWLPPVPLVFDEDGHPLPDDAPAPALPLLPAPRAWQPRTV